MKYLLSKARKLWQQRPAEFWSLARGYLLFLCSGYWLRLKGIPSEISLGKNVRIQRLSSLRVERGTAALSIGEHSIVYERALLEVRNGGTLRIGHSSILGDARIVCRSQITIGSHFLSSWNVFIQDFDPHPIEPRARMEQVDSMVQRFRPQFDSPIFREEVSGANSFSTQPITIGNNVWVGANASILKGAVIGDGSIVATGAVVTRGEYPAGSILAGNPARVVRTVREVHTETPVNERPNALTDAHSSGRSNLSADR